METVTEYYAKDRAAWRRWLAENHDTKTAVWLIYDKGAARKLSWQDIVQEALCFGWIDSKPGKVSESRSKIYVSRPNPKSAWSKINKAHIAELMKTDLMTPAGQAVIDETKKNGARNIPDKSDNLEMPPDLAEALAKSPKAETFYESMSPSSKRIILEWIYSAKRDETRAARIKETVESAAAGIKAHHYRQ